MFCRRFASLSVKVNAEKEVSTNTYNVDIVAGSTQLNSTKVNYNLVVGRPNITINHNT